jgi:hypothetical protein
MQDAAATSCPMPTDSLHAPAKVTELQLMRLGVDQKVLRLNVPMTNPEGVNVRQRPAQLIDVQLTKAYTAWTQTHPW